MAIKDRLIERLGLVTAAQAGERATRAYEAGYQDGGEDEPTSGTTRKQGWRASAAGAIRDLGGMDYGVVLNAAWQIYLSNPVARRYLQIKRDYILGGGVKVAVDDDKLQKILDAFWNDNRIDNRLRAYTLQLFLLGEQIFPVFVRESDGRVRLGYIDPSEIERIITHPDNVLEKWAVVLKERAAGSDAWVPRQDRRVYRIVRLDEGAALGEKVKPSKHEGRMVTAEQATLEAWEAELLKVCGLAEYTGSCFYVSVNDLSNQPRGYSDLLQVSDWLDQLDAILFALADREQMADYFSFDVTLAGQDEAGIKTRAQEFRAKPPKKGSVNVHNEKETWNMNRPDLGQAGSIEASNQVLTFILGGMGLPRHWYGFGDETNRATAAAQGDPTWRTMEQAQDTVRDMALSWLTFARDQAAIAGAWSGKDDEEITLTMPEMTSRDVTVVSNAMNVTAQALTAVDALKLQTRERAAEIWAKVVAELGVEIDPAEELEAIDKLEEEEEEADAAQTNQDWQAALQGANGNQPQPGETPPQLAPFAQATQELPKSWEG